MQKKRISNRKFLLLHVKSTFTQKMENKKQVKVLDREFEIYIPEEKILERVNEVAAKLNRDYKDRTPLLIGILNGSFVFAADLVRRLNFPHEIQFGKFSSYSGMDTTGTVRELIGISSELKDRDIIIVEDIIDTGTTMASLLDMLKSKGTRSIEICTLLMKPGKLQTPLNVKYCAMEIPNDFILGYGLDYDGQGRNLRDIYVVK